MAGTVERGEKTKILSDLSHTKSALRSEIRAALTQLSPAERATASQQARALLEKQTIWREAKTILFYAPLPEELDVWSLLLDAIAAGKTALLPQFDAEQNHYVACQIIDAARDVARGRFGIREPAAHCARMSLKRLDLMLIPGVAFDLHGHRLGRGKGFYDRLLSVLEGPACGVAFDEQVVAHVPVEPHDIRLSHILTPTRWHCESSCARL